jgi:hypothetical protein
MMYWSGSWQQAESQDLCFTESRLVIAKKFERNV